MDFRMKDGDDPHFLYVYQRVQWGSWMITHDNENHARELADIYIKGMLHKPNSSAPPFGMVDIARMLLYYLIL